MADGKDDSIDKPTPEAWIDAEDRIRAYLERHAGKIDIAPIQDRAMEKWLRSTHVNPKQHAKRALQDHWRSEETRRHLVAVNRDAIEQRAVGGHAATPEPEGRVRRYDLSEEVELRADVLSYCGEEFRKRFDFDWNDEWNKSVLTSADPSEDEKEAHKVHEQLRIAMERALEFVERPRGSLGYVPLGLGWWVPQHIAPLMKHAFMRKREPGPRTTPLLYEAALHRFIATWDSYNIMELPPRRDGLGSRVFDEREFAITWFLAGGWLHTWPPKKWPSKGFTVMDIVARQEDAVRKAIKKAGKRYVRGPETSESEKSSDSEV